MRAVLKAVNGLLAVAVIAVLGAIYWYLWRPVPQMSGELKAPVLSEVTIVRDALGVPHITAKSMSDAMFAQGYATAQDRLWQMDTIRRLASGELSEILGRAALESDQSARKLRLRRLAERSVLQLSADDRATLGAYARGVNHYIETHRGALPVEFRLLAYQPRPWRMADTLVVGLEMYRTLTTTWDDDLGRAQMRDGGDAAKVMTLYPARSGKEIMPGSNAWAISGKHTASGKPILANDPHLSFSLPSTWHMVHIKSPEMNVAGATLPGVPGVISGHNDSIAWGITNLGFDVQDLYSEQIDMRNGRYTFRGEVRQAQAESDWIAVKGEKPVQMLSWVTQHGPIFTGDGGKNYSLRWSAAEFGLPRFVILAINRARNWDEFRRALKDFPGPGQNFVYADREGNIGYQATGWLPVRKGFDGSYPLDGASGESEWGGIIPFEEMPSSFNPASGRIVSANQNVFSPAFPYGVSGQFASHYRQKQIDDRLQSGKSWKPEEMLAVQKDVYSGFNVFLARVAMDAVKRNPKASPAAQDGARFLQGWNGQMEKGTPQPVLAQLLFQHVRRAMAECANKEKAKDYRPEISAAVVEGLLTDRPTGWFANWDEMLTVALSDAVDEGRRMQGRNMEKWDWGALNEVTIVHPVAGRISMIAKYFNIGPVKMSGSSYTIKQTTRRIGPSMRFVADLADWEGSLMNLTIGESEQRLSGHYNDQWNAYYTGKSFPLQYGRVDDRKTLRLTPR